MKPEEVPAIRGLIYQRVACAFPAHVWARLQYRDLVILILCEECGRTPNEALNEMKIEVPRG